MNHIVRIFYFQVLHLMSAGVDPILVFDGPMSLSRSPLPIRQCQTVSTSPRLHPRYATRCRRRCSQRPPQCCQDRRGPTLRSQLSHVIPLCRAVLNLLKLPHREARAESEAKCAALEAYRKVDVILTRDSNAFVFGAQRVLRKVKTIERTAMLVEFRMKDVGKRITELQQRDFFLVAMMAAGDYDTSISGCGASIALEAVC